MKLIAITTPEVGDEDVGLIRGLLRCGIDIIHLRKPCSDIRQCRKLLNELTENERKRIVIHDYPELYGEFSLKGIHINRNVTALPEDYTGSRTRSCHSFEEIVRYKNECDYLFLSPVFDSISKPGYKAGFSQEELRKASDEGIIDEKVVALGGITFDSIPYLKSLNFGGVAMLGSLYDAGALEYLSRVDFNHFQP